MRKFPGFISCRSTRRDDIPIWGSPRLLAPMALLPALILAMAGCRRNPPAMPDREVLVAMADSVLTFEEVERQIPAGLAPEDSAALFSDIVDAWVENMVLADMAATKLTGMEEIERKTADYRNRLIIARYKAQMRRSHTPRLSEDSVRTFYLAHRQEMTAEAPLVKGIMVKLPAKAGGIENIKRCLAVSDGPSIDELESKWVSEALQYEFFNETWVDWRRIADQIPYRFPNPDSFLSETKDFETERNGSLYLLHITDYLPSGSELPYDFAKTRIEAMLGNNAGAEYTRNLVDDLIKEAIRGGKLIPGIYDPVSGKVDRSNNNKTTTNL